MTFPSSDPLVAGGVDGRSTTGGVREWYTWGW